MNPEAFKNSTAGKCIRTITRPPYWAYVPNPLPPKIEVDWELASLLSKADITLGELSGTGQLLPNPHLLIRPFIRREAVMSSRIENTQSGLEDLFLFEADETETSPVSDVKEIFNYVRAMEHGVKRLRELPISSRLTCEIHEILMKGVRGEGATPGLMRTSQNWIGSPGCTLMDATYVPPPVPEMKGCFSDLEKYIHSNAREPALIQCALVHYQFEAIHPFVDGNGRIGRLLITFMLLEKELLSQPLLYLSDFFEKHRDEYYKLLLNVSQKGDWKAWLTFFLNGVRQQSEDALLTVQKLLDLQSEYRALATSQKVPKSVNRLVDHLFVNPIISISELSKAWEIPFPTVQRGVDYLIEKGTLREITGRRRNRLFVADEILNTIMTEKNKINEPKEACDMSEADVGLSELPDGWMWTTLGEVSQPPQYGWTTSAKNRGKLHLLRTTDITSGYINWETVPFCQKEPDDDNKYLLKDGDIVISRAGSVGFSCLIKEPEQAVFASYLIRFRPVIIDELFLSYFLKSPAYWRAISESKLGIAVQNVNATKLKKISLPIAPLSEQHRIVAKIEELFTKLDAGINELHKAQSQLKRYRQSVLKAAFEGKLTEAWRAEHQEEIEPASVLLERILKARREKWEAEQLEQMQAKGEIPKDDKWKAKYKEPVAPDTGDLPELPNGWRWTTVGSIGLVASGQTPKGINDLNLDGEIPFYKISDMNKLGNERFMRAAEIALDDDQTARLGIHVREQGTVIFPKRGGAIATNKKRILSCPSAYDLNIMGVLPYIVPTDFFYQWLLSINLAALSDGSNVPQLNHKDIDPLPFPLPPLLEQQAIVSEVESRLSVTDEVEKTITAELKRAEQLRQSILKKAFSGELVPQDPNDEPASVLLEQIRTEKFQYIRGQLMLKLV